MIVMLAGISLSVSHASPLEARPAHEPKAHHLRMPPDFSFSDHFVDGDPLKVFGQLENTKAFLKEMMSQGDVRALPEDFDPDSIQLNDIFIPSSLPVSIIIWHVSKIDGKEYPRPIRIRKVPIQHHKKGARGPIEVIVESLTEVPHEKPLEGKIQSADFVGNYLIESQPEEAPFSPNYHRASLNIRAR